ncbi:hypothetical protein OF83DRAFT_145948 [Amylostereum chailletii]|nr:hypothetical protein OF83DRAFT_145948 [Amylostereum chailletii]
MAFVLEHGMFRAWLTSGEDSGKTTLPTYRPTSSQEATFAFVAAKPGHPFEVHWEDTGSGHLSASYIFLDGELHPGRFLPGSGTRCRSGVRVGSDVERRFRFCSSSEPTTGAVPERPNPRKYGTIELTINYARQVGRAPPEKLRVYPDSRPGFERPLRAGYGGVHLTTNRPDHTLAIEHLNPEDTRPVAKFIWSYDTIERLVEARIAPVEDLPSSLPPKEKYSKKKKEQLATPDPEKSDDSVDSSHTVSASSSQISSPEYNAATTPAQGSILPTSTPSAMPPSVEPASSVEAASPKCKRNAAPPPATSTVIPGITVSAKPIATAKAPSTSTSKGKRKAASPPDTANRGGPAPLPPNPKRLRRSTASESNSGRRPRMTSAAQAQGPATVMPVQNPPPVLQDNMTPDQRNAFEEWFTMH